MSDSSNVVADAEKGSYRAVLRNRSFRNLLLASLTSSMGDWIGLFAIIELAKNLEGATKAGALAVSFVMIARIVPTLVIAPIAGVFVDRWDRKRTMVVTDIVRGGIMFIVPFSSNAYQLVLLTLCIEIASALFVPSKDAVVPTIVTKRDLVQANQLSLMSSYATLPVGALLCAVLIATTQAIVPDTSWLQEHPESVPIMLNAASFFFSIIFINRMEVPDDHLRVREATPTERGGTLRELKDGIKFIAGMPLIRSLVVGIMAAFMAAGAVIGVGTFFATITNAGDAGFALLGFIVGSGLVVGFAIAGPLSHRIDKEWLFAPGIGLAGSMLVVAALMPTMTAAALPAALMGLGAGLSFVIGYTMLQEYSVDEIRGRLFAMVNSAVRAALFASLVLGPLTITIIGIELTAEQMAAGVEAPEDLEALANISGTYPYQIGGVRITLIMAGLIAVLGALYTGVSVHRVLREHKRRGPGLQDLAPGDGGGVAGRGALIVFEGGEGAGKSTQVRLLRAAVERVGLEAVVTREPGGTNLGEKVRQLLLDPGGEVSPRAEALLYSAARSQHTAQVLRPALERGAIVLCDRFVDSSIVYQGVARGLGSDVISELNRWATDDLEPDLVILLDIDPTAGLHRASLLETPDRLEAEGLSFHAKVNEGFRLLAALSPERYLVVDASEPVEVVQALIRARVANLLDQAVEALGSETELVDARQAAEWLDEADDSAPRASRATRSALAAASALDVVRPRTASGEAVGGAVEGVEPPPPAPPAEALDDAVPDVSSEVSPDATPEATPDATSDQPPAVALDVAPDVAPDGAETATTAVTQDLTPSWLDADPIVLDEPVEAEAGSEVAVEVDAADVDATGADATDDEGDDDVAVVTTAAVDDGDDDSEVSGDAERPGWLEFPEDLRVIRRPDVTGAGQDAPGLTEDLFP